MDVVLIAVAALMLIAVVGAFAFRARSRADHRRGAIEPPPSQVLVEPPPAPLEVEPAPVLTEPRPAALDVGERARLRDRLGKTRAALAGYLRSVTGRAVDDDVWDELEEALLLADVGVGTTSDLLDAVRARAAELKVRDADEVVALLRSEIEGLLDANPDRELHATPGRTSVWMFVGVNGVGKTTTIGKLAAQQIAEGKLVVLAAADTFRAAAAEQLGLWAQRTGSEIVRGDEGADPGSIVFDAMTSAAAKGADLLLVDTAGRLHTKHNLMAELEKLRRIVERTPGALHEVLLVIDASTGQNGLQQARQFADAVDVTGIVLTKLDGTAKGGIVLAIQRELKLPVKAVGVGEAVGDLIEFDAREFSAGLFEGDS